MFYHFIYYIIYMRSLYSIYYSVQFHPLPETKYATDIIILTMCKNYRHDVYKYQRSYTLINGTVRVRIEKS